MRLAVTVLLVFGFFGLGKRQDYPSSKQAASPAVGLQVGQQAPTFASRVKMRREQLRRTVAGFC
jgi:hypothetical protein